MPFSALQQEYLHNATHRWNFKTGATRSGKTWLDYAYVIPRRIMRCSGSGLIVLLGNTQGTVNRNVLEPMRKLYGAQVGEIRSGDNTVQMFGRKVFVLGADKRNRVATIQGAGIEYCYGDEVATWSEEVFSMLKSRLDCPNSVFDGTCNPDHPGHWVKKFLDSDADIYHQHYTIDDNPFLAPEFVANLKKEYEGTVYYQRYILGEWTQAHGLIYPKHANALVDSEPREYSKCYISCDYGIHNPTCFGLFGLSGRTWYLIDEYYHSGRKTNEPKTDDEYYQALEQFAGERNISAVIVDPSASSFITLIRRKGRFAVQQGDNSVLDGIRHTATAMSTGVLKIDRQCKNMIDEFQAYSWDDKTGVDTPIKDNDHMCDLLRYFVQTLRIAEPRRKLYA